jgi:hypothetical protein
MKRGNLPSPWNMIKRFRSLPSFDGMYSNSHGFKTEGFGCGLELDALFLTGFRFSSDMAVGVQST